MNSPCRRFFGLQASLLYAVVDLVEPSHLGVELFLLLAERLLMGEHPGLALALVLLLLVRGVFGSPIILPLWRGRYEASPSSHLSGIGVRLLC